MTKKNILLCSVMALFLWTACSEAEKYQYPFQNPKLKVEERVDNLMSLLTLQEKVSMMINRSLAIERLGIPAYNWWGEACHGLIAGGVTVFPQSIALAATFDDSSQLTTYTMVSDEARARYNTLPLDGDIGPYVSAIPNLTFWAPNINIFRDPRWGRGQETYGEDPFLMSRMGLNVVLGMQGDDEHYYKTHACAKHYGVHSGPEPLRHEFNAVVSMRDLWETYLPAFETLVVKGNVREVMCAYSAYEGEPCCASNRLLVDILRNRWGFDGMVVSDCDAINDFYVKGRHETHPDAAAASADAVLTGTDLECGRSYNALIEAVEKGIIKEQDLDVSLRRILTERFRLGLLDPAKYVPYSTIPGSVIDCQEHRDHALKMAHESQVLLKNEGNILPLDKNIKSIAVVGPNINDSIMMRGNYSGSPTYCITILQGLKNKLPNTRIISERGSEIDSDYLQIPQMHLVNHDGQKGFLAQYYAKPDFSGEIINTSHAEVINFRTEGGYGFGKDVPASDFSAKYSGTYVPDFTGTLCFSVRGDNYVLKVNNKKIGEYVPKELSFKYTPGMNLTEAQRREFTESMKGRRGSIYTLQVKEGETYQIALDYKSGKEGSVSHLSVDMYERKLAVFEELKEKIKDVEAIIYVGGITPTQEGEGHERAKIELPDVQKRFLKAMHETGKPVIYVNCSGSAIALADIDYAYDALLQAWYPGQEGGTAVADVLFGDYNPSGKLPVTFYKSTEQLPEFTDYSMENRTYRYFKGEPQYAFGYGLSYTDFEFGEALLSSSSIKAGEKVEITIPLTNVGKMDGAEVVQVYVKSLTNPDAPIKSLKGYVRQEIKAGKSEKVRITLEPESFAYYNADVDGLKVFPGKYQILYGNSSRDMDLRSLDLEVTPAVQ